ncbi:hypothetical protein [Campylobacter concisus]|uniref:Transglycosylase SLT domain-containing protein n=1 Tax=Campylobacter concisus TaxID=199 RepID=A0A1Y5MF40_9BACT|nr:hypothetical protein [Campylobacter concisus]OUT06857.1 hypothetical protein B9N65_09765 [Campylobacter concisus]OUT08979.1 hypothetical protein B9N65_01160 [Campylobacter concisus]
MLKRFVEGIGLPITLFVITFVLCIIVLRMDYNQRVEIEENKDARLVESEKALADSLGLVEHSIALETSRMNEINTIYAKMRNKDIDLAELTYRAAREYDIDAGLLTALINSESEYSTKTKHSNPTVSGLGGINAKYWKIPNKTYEEQIYATAFILSYYLTKYNGDYMKALTAYKGISDSGRVRARQVLKEYEEQQ